MKKTFLLAIMVLTAIASFAQNPEQPTHLTFKGVPIDGTLSIFILMMEKNGFTHVETEGGIALLKGDFAGYKNCVVGVATQKQKDLVSKITVLFPAQTTWSMLSSNYFSLKEMLTEKYGKPDVLEEFDANRKPEDDNSKMFEVKMDRCKYSSVYKTDKGNIELSISHESVASCFVMLTYYDKINGDKIRAKAIDDL